MAATATAPGEIETGLSIDVPKPDETLRDADPELYGRAILAGKLAAIMSEVGHIEKRGENTEFHYHYATESDVAAALRPAMARYGVCMVPEVEITDTRELTTKRGTVMQLVDVLARVTFICSETGASVTVSMPGSGVDTMDKSASKAATGAIKYALMKAFNISTGDDPERTRPGEASDEPVAGQRGSTGRDYEIKENQRKVIWGRARGADIENDLLYRILRYATRGKVEHPDGVRLRSQLDYVIAALDHFAANRDADFAEIEAWEEAHALAGKPAGEKPAADAELPPDPPAEGPYGAGGGGGGDDDLPFAASIA